MPDPVAIGIDLGGTQVRVALVQGGRVLARASEPTDVAGGPEAVLRQFARLTEKVTARADPLDIIGVGVASPGPLDSGTGTIIDIPTLPGWSGFPLRDMLTKQMRLPVVLENDGIAAAFGEWRHGAGQGLRHLVYVTVSTGIGGGVIIDDRVLRGRRGMAGHVGHMPVVLDGPVCSCGGQGCFEALASGRALGRAARAGVASCPDSRLSAEPPDILSAQHVVAAARQGDALALRLLDDEARYLGLGFTGLIHLFSPEAVIMGGGVSQAFDLLSPGIHSGIQERAMAAFRNVRVLKAGLGENSGLIGAAALALDIEGATA
ncbi:ROK family protein [Rubellimicrobium rubrum]|uniref:ROK family protein n=1 Tax=Rubellimicrobium rubrum TaxID=2585369 RepID=A0A5C4MZ56_9RHOB|nr:ROK family protein [Rubellimicrobium rubrum]TNC50425.1 ROK family protein [Rubellimicrobium rubrum]